MTADNQPRWLASLLGAPGIVLALVWGFSEGTLFFVVPDVAFTLSAGLNPKRGLLQFAVAIVGAFLAGCVMYSWAAATPRMAQNTVAAVPFVGAKMLEDTSRRFEERGAWAMLENPLGGVPYKVYAVLAPAHFSYARFLLLTIPSRAERMLITLIPAALVGIGLQRFTVARRWKIAVGLHGACWIAVYAYYWSKLWPA